MTEVGQELVLELSHPDAAPREEVFDAWTNPEVLKRWWAAAPTWERALMQTKDQPRRRAAAGKQVQPGTPTFRTG